MQLKIFVTPIKNLSEAEGEMNRFLRSHRILSVKKEFVPDGENSFWSFCVEYLDRNEAEGMEGKGNKVDYKEVLNEKDFAVFSRLRVLRKELAEKEAIPAYAIFTNEQLAKMVQTKANSLAALQKVDGVGEARAAKYGAAFLKILQEAFPA